VKVVPRKPFLTSDTPVDFFMTFFDEELFDIIVGETNVYAHQNKLRNWSDTSYCEMTAFLALLIGMIIHSLPRVELYWSSDHLYRVQPMADVMTVKRFKKIRQAFHLNDNAKAPKQNDMNFDKLYKVRPLLDKLNIQFQNECVSTLSQSMDEAMILFKGRHSIKQYMPLKPIKRGYKVWMRCDTKTATLAEIIVKML